MNKAVYVKAHFCPIGENVEVKVPTGRMKKGLFGEKEEMEKVIEWKQTGWSDSQIDGQRLNEDINDAVKRLNEEGYEVQSILPILSGAYSYDYKYKEMPQGGWGYGYGYGYSYTEGVTIIAKKMNIQVQ
ncbi:hypothetical protein CFN16_10925 [Pseudomonas fluorescens]|uniref:Uncharacterized protein n=1 Tax=Pseudomonas fluorescens TaxID=294 RepID=A0A345UVW5_PSEFL|nr:hypothetical protein [Pseudomonas fluorescens]AXJ04617.1 hypothetical protein CFN16_10925 [Pseudomonas fluorescens]WJK12227.1 hypothetical protein QR290_13080 [Pseudomonas fluorescens]